MYVVLRCSLKISCSVVKFTAWQYPVITVQMSICTNFVCCMTCVTWLLIETVRSGFKSCTIFHSYSELYLGVTSAETLCFKNWIPVIFSNNYQICQNISNFRQWELSLHFVYFRGRVFICRVTHCTAYDIIHEVWALISQIFFAI